MWETSAILNKFAALVGETSVETYNDVLLKSVSKLTILLKNSKVNP